MPLRCLLASFWVLLGCSWSHLGSHRRLCARFWMVLGASWLGFGELWGSFRYHFRRRCANCCRDPSMAFTLAFRYLLAARRYVRSTWNQIFKRFFGLFFSYCKFASFFAAFSMKFACFFKSRPSKFMRPRSVSWPSTPFNVFRINHQKSSKNPPKILPKPFPKPRKIDPKS